MTCSTLTTNVMAECAAALCITRVCPMCIPKWGAREPTCSHSQVNAASARSMLNLKILYLHDVLLHRRICQQYRYVKDARCALTTICTTLKSLPGIDCAHTRLCLLEYPCSTS